MPPQELGLSQKRVVVGDRGVPTPPARHGVGEQDYLYVREPGGMRIEGVMLVEKRGGKSGVWRATDAK